MIFVKAPSFTIPYLGELMSSNGRIINIFARPSGPGNEKCALAPPPIGIFTRRGNVPIFRPGDVHSKRTLRVLGELGPRLGIIATCNGVLPPRVLCLPGFYSVGVRTSLLPGCHKTTPVR